MIKKIILNIIITVWFFNSAHGATGSPAMPVASEEAVYAAAGLTAPLLAGGSSSSAAPRAAAAAAAGAETPLRLSVAGSGDVAVPVGAGLGPSPGRSTAEGDAKTSTSDKEEKGEFSVYKTVMSLIEQGTKESLATMKGYKGALQEWYENEFRKFRTSFVGVLMTDGPESTKGDPFSRAIVLAVSSRSPAKKAIYREMIGFIASTVGRYPPMPIFPVITASHASSVGPICYAAEHGESELVLLLLRLGWYWFKCDGPLKAPASLSDEARNAIISSEAYIKCQKMAWCACCGDCDRERCRDFSVFCLAFSMLLHGLK